MGDRPEPPGSIAPWQVGRTIKLTLRLMGDRRVNIFLKLIPIASVLYVISPFDFPGPVDDFAVLLGGPYLFIELCPDDVVAEHLDEIEGKGKKPKDKSGDEDDDSDDVVDGTARWVEEQK